MKHIFPLLCLCFLFGCANKKNQAESHFVSSDIDLFWAAYDQITATEDSILQRQYLQEMYLDQGSEGLDGIIKARNYTPEEFL